MRYRLKVDGVVDGDTTPDALRRIGEHFLAWAADTPSDDPDTWTADASVDAPRIDGVVHLIPLDE